MPPADPVLVVDFGAQYAQLIARRVREAHVYSEIVPHSMPVPEMLSRRPVAIILSGGPSSVYADGAPRVQADLFSAGVPVFGICYGFQAMTQALGGEVAHTGGSEFGRTSLTITEPGVLLRGHADQQQVWMSHGDAVTVPPGGFTVAAATDWCTGGGLRAPDASTGRCAVPSRGDAHHARAGDVAAFPVRHRRGASDLDRSQHHR